MIVVNDKALQFFEKSDTREKKSNIAINQQFAQLVRYRH